MAILATKLDAIADKLDCMADHSTRIAVIESKQATQDHEIEKLRGQSNFWNGANSLLALIAGIVGYNRCRYAGACSTGHISGGDASRSGRC